MSDSKGFSSLFALVDNHLSKTAIRENSSEGNTNDPFPIPCLGNLQSGSASETLLSRSPGQRFPIPSPFNVSNSPINNVLAQQLSNMLIAKEKQKQEIKLKEQEIEKSNVVNEYLIDLSAAIQEPYQPDLVMQMEAEETMSEAPSIESLFGADLIDCEEKSETEAQELPRNLFTDVSYLFNYNFKPQKCSPFGRILTSRVKPFPAVYWEEKLDSNIVRFDFKTKSPCDLIKEKQKKPTVSTTFTFNDLVI